MARCGDGVVPCLVLGNSELPVERKPKKKKKEKTKSNLKRKHPQQLLFPVVCHKKVRSYFLKDIYFKWKTWDGFLIDKFMSLDASPALMITLYKTLLYIVMLKP